VPSQFAAYLRVYEPLAAFDRDRQRYWRRYLDEGRAVGAAEGPGRQRVAVMEALGAGWSRLPQLPEEAYVLPTENGVLICPWNLRVRVAEAALLARDGVPAVLADAFVPPVLAGLAKTVLSDFRGGARILDHGLPRLHEHVATWGVPLRWFLFVDPDEREVSVEPERKMLRYRTEIGQARRRAHQGLAILRKTMGDVTITESVAEGTRWLEEFHPGSMVELDYGGLVHLFSDEALLADDSPQLVADGLTALSQGDGDTATERYERLVDRWREIQLMERCN
jgi:hypothetical protein